MHESITIGIANEYINVCLQAIPAKITNACMDCCLIDK